MTTTLQILHIKAARAKIADPQNWGKGRRGENRDLLTYCAAEAIEDNGIDGFPYKARIRAFHALMNAAGIDYHLAPWNDAPERTHSEVLAAFDLAIATVRL